MPFMPGHNLGFNCFFGGAYAIFYAGHKNVLCPGIKLKLEDFRFF